MGSATWTNQLRDCSKRAPCSNPTDGGPWISPAHQADTYGKWFALKPVRGGVNILGDVVGSKSGSRSPGRIHETPGGRMVSRVGLEPETP
jgi:hypothetical protein